ncbi:MAG: bacillithiol biosynthesis deacetylase BshB1 [Cytophagales bacterium]|nr:bacillithiol biosynthesis deacetylase BshB1 [Cytophagales bacterium]
MKLDILVLAAHPDDAELACGGTIIKHIEMGYKVGVLDLTEGELGTRGTPTTRYAEAAAASKVLGLSVRDNLQIADGFFQNNEETQRKLIQKIRTYQPEILLSNAIKDRHIDHGRASQLADQVNFLAGLRKIETFDKEGNIQEPWRPKQHFHYIQDEYIQPDFSVDVTPCWEQKMDAIRAYETQFFVNDTSEKGPQTPISNPDFIYFLEARAREFGRSIGAKYAEGFTKAKQIGVNNLFDLK